MGVGGGGWGRGVELGRRGCVLRGGGSEGGEGGQ